ncbi:MAG: SAM-dependent chlorinase/fluorinase [Solirubrobacterales bacterium]|nr:SAM-dependent chlorinase/fluorinase [Solirubrobacterales bacterium]
MPSFSFRRDTEPGPLITLLTDYGTDGIYVGVLHALIGRICANARVLDVTHAVAPGDVTAGALALLDALPYLPQAIHVAVVDPDVGTERRAVALLCENGHTLIGPDNGVLMLAANAAGGVKSAYDISASQWRLSPVSPTFHGRDVFVPVAASLAAGNLLSEAGTPFDPGALVSLELPNPEVEDRRLTATVTAVDRFGNLALLAMPADAERAGLEPGGAVMVGTHAARFGKTFADVGVGRLLLHVDSTGRLALAVNQGNAAERLGVGAGDRLTINN